MNVPMTPTQCRSVILWLSVVAILTVVLLWGSGCEGIDRFASDPYLHQLATEEAAKLTARYGVESPKQINIQWCDDGSKVWAGSTGVIEIDVKHRGNETATRWVIRHELRHLLWQTGSDDFANGEQEKPL
jgi:hypothetical protein